MAQCVKNLPVMQEIQETWVQFLSWEDPLGEGMATHSSILAWRIPWTEEPGGYCSQGRKELDTTEVTEHPQARVRTHRFCSVPAVLEIQRLHHRVRLFMW